MLKLLIAIDGSDHARHAVEAAGRLARELADVQVLLFHVRELPIVYGDLPAFDYEAVEQSTRDHQSKLLAEAQAQALHCGLTQVETLAGEGAVAAEIARVASERAVDHIIIGTHGRNALAGLVMGSVAQRVVHLAKVPVLLVK